MIKYEPFIDQLCQQRVFNEGILSKSVSWHDVAQEVKIQLWYYLRNKYDSDKGNVDTFIKTHVHYVLKGVVFNLKSSIKTTGKIGRKRTQQAELQSESIYFNQDTNRGSKGKYLCDKSLWLEIVDDLDFEFDWEVICDSIKHELTDRSYEFFKLMFVEGYNQLEVSKVLYVDPASISKSINFEIKPALIKVLKKVGYLE